MNEDRLAKQVKTTHHAEEETQVGPEEDGQNKDGTRGKPNP